MTQRKPTGVSFESWVERQVRQAQERGGFDDLPGAGRPLLRGAFDDGSWLRSKARRENLPLGALLPPGLALAKEVEDLPDRIEAARSEPALRALLEDLDARILQLHKSPQVGPPVRVRRLDVEALVELWRQTRPAASAPLPAAAVPPLPPEPERRRPWWRRR